MKSVQSSAPVVIAAGGTGGHLFPAQALAQELIRRGRTLVLVTDARGRDYATGFPASEIIGVDAATFANRGPVGRIAAAISIARGVLAARGHLKRLKPAAVVGFGGYPAMPAMAAAILGKTPACIHEQNAVLGRVNRALAPYVTCIASTFPSLKGLKSDLKGKVVVTGNPVRDAVVARAGTPYETADAQGQVRLLVFGGSQGARVFAELVPPALARLDASLRARLHVVQQARPEDDERVRKAYDMAGIVAEIKPFFTDLPERMIAAHLVIARGGAGTVCELAALGRPAIIVPLPSAMDDHQTANAESLKQAGAAWVVREKGLTADALAKTLSELLADPAGLARAAATAKSLGKPEAVRVLADLVEGLNDREPSQFKRSAASVFLAFLFLFSAHFVFQFLSWSGAVQEPMAHMFWSILSAPLFALAGTLADKYFWTIFVLNSAIWASMFALIVWSVRKRSVA